MAERRILAVGGGASLAAAEDLLAQLGRRPRVLWVGTAGAERPERALSIQDRLRDRAEVRRLEFFPWPPEDLRDLVLSHDAILVGGGNTANMLAIWRVHGFDALLREAWEQGVVLIGSSAGMICWFEAGVTDSFGPRGAPPGAPVFRPGGGGSAAGPPSPQGAPAGAPVFRPGAGGSAAAASSSGLEGMGDGLGFLPGSACPHYDDEEHRAPLYRRLVAEGFPPGYAADAGVGLHFVGTELAEVVSPRDGATAYRVEPGLERALPARLLVQLT